ncbi:MAG: HlyD family efflux transporter periplasmic adaptor subunit [Planctomycetaceae bacterium]|nr:HlyD family efflux transporter periplasmic adaptor subunit [Planctomycetaceae bacterium]
MNLTPSATSLRRSATAPALTYAVRFGACALIVTLLLLSTSISSIDTPQFLPIPLDGFTTVIQKDFQVILDNPGDIESANNVVFANNCEYPTRIVSIVEEGTWVEPGDVIVELDSSGFHDYAQKRRILLVKAEKVLKDAEEDVKIQELTNASRIAEAELDAQLAEMKLRGYIEAEYPQAKHQLESAAILAKEKLIAAEKQLKFIADMVRLGYRSQEDYEKQRLTTMKAQQASELAAGKVQILVDFTHARTLASLKGNLEEAQQHVERTKAVAKSALYSRKRTLESRQRVVDIHARRLEKAEESIAACTIRANTAGEVVLGTTSSSSEVRLKEGDSVYYLQILAKIPDRDTLQVNLRIHESKLRYLNTGISADVKVEAANNDTFAGRVVSVSRVPLRGRYPNYDLREYEVIVEITEPIERVQRLTPGMTAHVALQAVRRPNAMTVPLSSVVHIGRQHYAFVLDGEEIVPREVELGDVSETSAEIRHGLNAGEEVVEHPRVDCADRLIWLEASSTL